MTIPDVRPAPFSAPRETPDDAERDWRLRSGPSSLAVVIASSTEIPLWSLAHGLAPVEA